MQFVTGYYYYCQSNQKSSSKKMRGTSNSDGLTKEIITYMERHATLDPKID